MEKELGRRDKLAKIVTDRIIVELNSSAQGSVMLGILPPVFNYDFSLKHVFSRFNRFIRVWDYNSITKISIDGDSFLGDYIEKSKKYYIDEVASDIDSSIHIDDSKTEAYIENVNEYDLDLVVKLYSYEGKEYKRVFAFKGVVDPEVDTISIALPDYNDQYQKNRCATKFNSNFVDMLTEDILDEVRDKIESKVENKNGVRVIISSFNMLYIIKQLTKYMNKKKKEKKEEVNKTVNEPVNETKEKKKTYKIYHYAYNNYDQHIYMGRDLFKGETLDEVVEHLKRTVKGFKGGLYSLYSYLSKNNEEETYITLNNSYKDDIYLITTSENIDNDECHLKIINEGYKLYPVKRFTMPSLYGVFESMKRMDDISFDEQTLYLFTNDIEKAIDINMNSIIDNPIDKNRINNLAKYGYRKSKNENFFTLSIYDDISEEQIVYYYE